MSRADTNKEQRFSAKKLRIVLFLTMILIVLGSAAAFSYGVNFVRSYALEISKKRSDAEQSNSSLQSLQTTEQLLKDNQGVIKKAEQLRADGKSNTKYPEIKIINMVKQIARANNIGIASISATGGSSAGSGTTAPSGSSSTTQPNTPGTAGAAVASDTVSVSVALTSPTNYRDYLQFLYDIEQSLPIMKVDGIDISPSNNSQDQITAGTLTIHMYIKQGV